MKIEIDVDLGPYAKEWEPVAFRRPLKGEWFITDVGHPHVWSFQEHTNPRLIIRRKWKWPEWLKAEWIFRTRHSGWLATFEKPMLATVKGDQFWNYGCCVPLHYDTFDFTPPSCDDWTKSLIRNPNLPAKE